MAIKINVSQEDVARTRLIGEAGWYTVVIKDITQERNKKGDADNFVFSFEVVDHPTEAGVRARTWVSEKAMGMIIPILAAVGVEVPNSGLADFDIEPAKGRKLSAFIKAEDNDGRMNNNIKEYKKL